MKSESEHSISFKINLLTITQSGNGCLKWQQPHIVLNQVDVSDNQAVRSLEPFLFKSHLLTIMKSEIDMLVLQNHISLGFLWPAAPVRMSRRFSGKPPPLWTHPSGRYRGKPPALTPPGHKGKGKGSRSVVSAPEESICDTIDHSNLRGVFQDLCYWQSHVTTVEELAGKVTSAVWYPLILGKLAESVVVISGAPNVGKSSLAVHLAKALGLTRTKTTSKNFWLFARSQRPYFSLWVYCTDSFWSEDEPSWPRMRQSISSVTSNEEFGTGAVILEGHRIFAFPGYADLATTIIYLTATDKLLFERGTEARSIRKHKLFLSNVLDQLQKLNKMIILEGAKSQVYLVCQALQIALLEDAGMDASICRRTSNSTGGGHFDTPQLEHIHRPGKAWSIQEVCLCSTTSQQFMVHFTGFPIHWSTLAFFHIFHSFGP